jgi:hypothetical protein
MPGGYVVRDANDQALAYVYGRANEAEAMQAKVLTDDEARRVAVNIGGAAGAFASGGMIDAPPRLAPRPMVRRIGIDEGACGWQV